MKAIGLDIGTTGICGILIDIKSGEALKTVCKKNESFIKGLEYESLQSPDIIMQRVGEILDELLTDDIKVIGVTGQMHGILYTDMSGTAISPLYTWQDGRGDLEYNGTTYAEYFSSHSGYGNVTNFYNRVNSLIPQGAVHFCTIHDYAVMKLTGRKTPLVHISDAASFGCFDIQKRIFTIDDPLLPEICENAEIAGYMNGIPVCVAIGDNQASFIGCGCGEGDVLINIGTGAQVSVFANTRTVPDTMEIRPLSGTQDIIVGSSLCGGRAFAALEAFFEKVVEMSGNLVLPLYEYMEKYARTAENTQMRFDTQFSGTRIDPQKRASVYNITEDNFTPGDMVYACLKGISGELYEMYSKCSAMSRAVASGNCVRKTALLREILEQDFKMKIFVPENREEASLGAALFALVASGEFTSLKEARRLVKYDI